MKHRAFILFFFIAGLVSCDKVVTHCDYEVITLEELTEGDGRTPLENVVGYLFTADTNEYYIESYAAAVNGELKRVDQVGVKRYEKKTEYETASGALTFRALGKGTFILVICDMRNEIYAYKQVEIPEGMVNDVVVRLTFYPYRFEDDPGISFLVNKWIQKK